MAVITVSGGVFSGGKELAECISEKLGYRLVAQEQLLPHEASRLGVPGDEPETALTGKFGLLDGPVLRRILYNAYMQVAICEDAKSDGVVYHGQVAHLLLRKIPHHLGIRVMADIQYRIRSAMKYRLLNYEKAAELIRDRDTERDRWTKGLYHADRNDPSYYDIVINSVTMDIADACEMIVRTIRDEIRTTPESMRVIDDLIMVAELKTRIALDRNAVYQDLDIEVRDGVVILRGTLPSAEEADKIRALVLQQPGVKEIKSLTSVRW